MTIALINPGTGSTGGTAEQAEANLRPLLDDAGLSIHEYPVWWDRTPDDDFAGRFAFTLWLHDRECGVLMPGMPLDDVRYMREPGQSSLSYPRLYVDDSSWWWCFAASAVKYALTGDEG